MRNSSDDQSLLYSLDRLPDCPNSKQACIGARCLNTFRSRACDVRRFDTCSKLISVLFPEASTRTEVQISWMLCIEFLMVYTAAKELNLLAIKLKYRVESVGILEVASRSILELACYWPLSSTAVSRGWR